MDYWQKGDWQATAGRLLVWGGLPSLTSPALCPLARLATSLPTQPQRNSSTLHAGGQHIPGATPLWSPPALMLGSSAGPSRNHILPAASVWPPSPPMINGTITTAFSCQAQRIRLSRAARDGCAATAHYKQHLSWALHHGAAQAPGPPETHRQLPILHRSMSGGCLGGATPMPGWPHVPASLIPPG